MNAKRNPNIDKHLKDYETYKNEYKKIKKAIKSGQMTYEDFDRWLYTQDK